MLTLDTSGLFAALNQADPFHPDAVAILDQEPGPLLVPAAAVTEIAWIIQARIQAGKAHRMVLDGLLQDLEAGAYTLDCGDQDLPRIRALLTKYDDLGLDYPDAAVIACAERNQGRVLTTDHRHFPIVARGEKSLTVLPLPG